MDILRDFSMGGCPFQPCLMTYFDKVTIGWQEICLPFSHQRFQVQQLGEGGTHVQSRTLLQNWSRSHTDEEIAWSKERSRDRLIIVCVSSFWQHQWHQRIAMDSSMKWSVLCLTKKTWFISMTARNMCDYVQLIFQKSNNTCESMFVI